MDISDIGIGISSDQHKRIFKRFYQTDKSRKSGSGRGVGLGLAIAKQIVTAHNGEIGVTSEMNQSTTFVVKLPVNHAKIRKPNM